MRIASLFLFVIACFFTSCREEKKVFRLLDPKKTGITFVNEITERDTLNILDMEFVYNGGGVGIGDVNGDGLDDIYFTGNQVENKLYLNKGKLRFEDITASAGVQKKNQYQWSSGVNMLDINLDGKLDIYVCNTVSPDSNQRRNMLFINEGNDANGVPHFRESAKEYGVDDPSHSSHAQFFDYDNDGDLDLFVGVNFIDHQYPNQFITRRGDGSAPTRDNLFRNDWNDTLGHPVFTDVSLKAGIVWAGYSHSTLICDFNEDGWQDIYVANDYLSNDLLYINNRDGTFSNRIADIFKHQSMSSMGSDLGDFDNDGRADIFTTEMQPYYNKRKKLFQGGSSYQMYLFNEQYKYEYQYTRNTLQRNSGINPESGLPIFSEVGLFAGVQETDWSWSPLFADFDNDGFRDLYVTNGFPRDVTDHDFAEFRKTIAGGLTSKNDLYQMIPQVKSPNFMFKNNGDLSFSDVSKAWGLSIPSFTNGSAYADLDNDGDLDLVTNNIDDYAFVLENQSHSDEGKTLKNNYLRVKLVGSAKNPDAFGAQVTTFYGGKKQTAFLLSGRGYLSQSENTVHFGLGEQTVLDSVVVLWPDRRRSVEKNVSANRTLPMDYAGAGPTAAVPAKTGAPPFSDAARATGLAWKDEENDYIDFNFQRTIPHKFSQYGPCIAVGDANSDALDDIFIGGSGRYDESWFFQRPDGTFRRDSASYKTYYTKKEEDSAALLFDADNDGDNDLYIVRGSGQHPAGDSLYQDILCVNNGKGHFKISPSGLPLIWANGSCVKAADYDADGDLDLFVGSRVLPKAYPLPDRCFLLRNDSQTPDNPMFTDVTEAIAPGLLKPGLISDALWTDFNGDNLPDLILAGEWMPLTFFENKGGRFENATAQTGLQDKTGWWNSLAAADLDNDGDMDYMAGNFGLNLYFRCTEQEPLHIYAKDFDNNSSIDPFISCYWKDSVGEKHEYFYHPREDMVKQWVGIRKKFATYGAYGEATVQGVFSKEELKGASILAANWMYTSFVENLGNGKFSIRALPNEAQLAPVYGILPYDMDKDGLLDILMVGNDYGMELQQGRADAFNGLVLRNLGNFQFKPLELEESRFIVPKDARGLTRISLAKGRELVLVTQNRAALRVFAPAEQPFRIIPLQKNEVKCLVTFKNGQKQLREFSWGSTFVSQESRSIGFEGNMVQIEFFDNQNSLTRKITDSYSTHSK